MESSQQFVIPPKGSGRPKGEIRLRIEALEVGSPPATFKASRRSTVGAAAWHVGHKLGREFATRLMPGGIVAVWRVG